MIPEKFVLFLCDNEEIKLGNETDDFIKRLVILFLNNYQKEEIMLRNGSNFVFESVLSYSQNKSEKVKFIH